MINLLILRRNRIIQLCFRNWMLHLNIISIIMTSVFISVHKLFFVWLLLQDLIFCIHQFFDFVGLDAAHLLREYHSAKVRRHGRQLLLWKVRIIHGWLWGAIRSYDLIHHWLMKMRGFLLLLWRTFYHFINQLISVLTCWRSNFLLRIRISY